MISPETIEQMSNMLLADRILRVHQIVEAIGISDGSVITIQKNQFRMTELLAKQVLRFFIIKYKRHHVITSTQYLALFNNSEQFLHCLITVVEIRYRFTISHGRKINRRISKFVLSNHYRKRPRMVCQPTKSL